MWRLRAHTAWTIGVALLLLILIGLTAGEPRSGQALSTVPVHDGDLWQNVIDRVRGGEGYYTAMEMALRTVHHDPPNVYAIRPFTNFRLPTLACFLAVLQYDVLGQLLLGALVVGAGVLWLVDLRGRVGSASRAVTTLMLAPLLIMAKQPTHYMFHDAWAGTLIALSLVLYERHRRACVGLGLLALFVREIAIPYPLVMMVCAWRDKDRRETLAWAVGIAAFALFFALHAHWASAHIRPEDPAKNWISYGGWAFAVSTARTNILSVLGVPGAHAVILPLSLLGAAACPGPLGTRIGGSLALYLVAFMIGGTPDNWYWGFLTLPLMAAGLAFAGPALRDLALSIAKPRTPRLGGGGR